LARLAAPCGNGRTEDVANLLLHAAAMALSAVAEPVSNIVIEISHNDLSHDDRQFQAGMQRIAR